MRKYMLSAIVFTSIVINPTAFASSGGGFNQSSFSQQKIDQQYELGKSYYKSRQADGSRLEYCIKNGDKLKKISRKAVKPFKKGPASGFINSLYSCTDPSVKIADVIADNQGDAILYYLNKRFKLRLKQG